MSILNKRLEDQKIRASIRVHRLNIQDEKKRRFETSFYGSTRVDNSENIPKSTISVTCNGKKCW